MIEINVLDGGSEMIRLFERPRSRCEHVQLSLENLSVWDKFY